MHPDAYAALAESCSAELRIKGSRFLALCRPVMEEADAAAERELIRASYPDASHHCWALRIGRPGQALCRDSDDGEPGGSAGPPIARALMAAELSDLLCVVVRWFGGTKLGVGGLIRAYGDTAREALRDPVRTERLQRLRLAGEFAYEHEPRLRALLERLEGRLLESSYDEQVHWIIALPPSVREEFEKTAADLFRGRFHFRSLGDESSG